MTGTALKRGAVAPRRKPAARKPAAPSITLPLSASVLRRNIALAIAALLLIIGCIAAGLAGLPQRLAAEFLQLTARMGLEVRHVEITGVHDMPRLAVWQAALPGRDNAMLTTDIAAIRTRLRALPWVADASVARRLPDTLDIDIVERRPVAIWQYQYKLVPIDIDGVRIAPLRIDRQLAGLPMVIGPDANRHIRELLTLTAAVPALGAKVDSATYVGRRRWNLLFKTGEMLLLPETPGAAMAAFQNFARLEARLPEHKKLLGSRFQRFDMRFPGKLVVGGPAVQQALEAAAKAAKTAKPTTI